VESQPSRYTRPPENRAKETGVALFGVGVAQQVGDESVRSTVQLHEVHVDPKASWTLREGNSSLRMAIRHSGGALALCQELLTRYLRFTPVSAEHQQDAEQPCP
jgi:hypothetical protein